MDGEGQLSVAVGVVSFLVNKPLYFYDTNFLVLLVFSIYNGVVEKLVKLCFIIIKVTLTNKMT